MVDALQSLLRWRETLAKHGVQPSGQPVGLMKDGATFLRNYEQTFSGKHVEIYAPFAYDAVYSIVEAMKIADSYESEKIAATMQ